MSERFEIAVPVNSLATLRRYWIVCLLLPLLTGVAVYGWGSLKPREYVSEATMFLPAPFGDEAWEQRPDYVLQEMSVRGDVPGMIYTTDGRNYSVAATGDTPEQSQSRLERALQMMTDRIQLPASEREQLTERRNRMTQMIRDFETHSRTMYARAAEESDAREAARWAGISYIEEQVEKLRDQRAVLSAQIDFPRADNIVLNTQTGRELPSRAARAAVGAAIAVSLLVLLFILAVETLRWLRAKPEMAPYWKALKGQRV